MSKKSIWCKKMVAIIIASIVFSVEGLTAYAGMVTLVSGITKVSANTSSTSSQYSTYWEYWSQGASQYSGMRSGGCRVTAFAKLIKEAGYAEFSNPDDFLLWGVSNGFFKSTSNVLELGTFGEAIGTYISQRNGNCTLVATNTLSNTSTDIANMMNYINQGYYVVLSSSGHTAYVGRAASLAQGTPVILDSWSSWITNPASTHTYTGSYDSMSGETFEKYRVYSISQKNTDTTAPVISNVRVTDITNEGYTVNCDVTDNVGVTIVAFPTWTDANGQDDLFDDWGNTASVRVPISGNTYSYRVNISEHNNEGGSYTTHIYAYDAAGNISKAYTSAYVDNIAPTITKVNITDIANDGYTVTCEATDNVDGVGLLKVCFPTWTDSNGQDDLSIGWGTDTAVYEPNDGNSYSYRINVSKHNNENGKYITSVHAYDIAGNYSWYEVTANVDTIAPTITNVQITDITNDGYTVTCEATDNADGSGMLKVCFPSWTDANGQDDLFDDWWNTTAVYSPISGNTYSYRVNISDHNNEEGLYKTEIHAYDTAGNYSRYEVSTDIDIVIPLQSITLNCSTLTLTVEETDKLSVATYNPSNTTVDKTVTWSSSDETVATVQADGTVAAKGVGRAIIMAEVAGKTSSCIVTVEPEEDNNQQVACTHTSTKSTTTKASASQNGKVVTKCTSCNEVISTTTISKVSSIKLGTTTYVYSGKVRKPSVTVTDANGKKLKSGTDYTVTYADGRKNVGKYNVKITLKGNYKGSKTLTFTIKPKSTSISKLTAKSKGFEIKWKKQNTQTTGYQIQYSTKSSFEGNTTKTITVKNSSTVNKSVSKLSANKKYYVRIRTYKAVTVNGKSTKIYSDWSNAKTVTTKK